MKTLGNIAILFAAGGFGFYEAFYATIPVDNQIACFIFSCCVIGAATILAVLEIINLFKK